MNDREEKVRIDNSSVKTICSNIQIPPYIELLSASIKVAITENSGQPHAQIEMREILAKQRDYPTIGKWVRSTIDKGLPNNNIVFTKKDHIMKKVYLQLKMIRGLLYREISDGERKQLVLPRVYHRQVLEGLLDDVGHPGRDRTISLARARFYWPGITSDIEKCVTSCERYLKRKSSTNIRAPLINVTTTYRLELVAMNYLTLEAAKGGMENILVVTGHFTKLALAKPCKNQTATTTSDALHNKFIVHYGMPTPFTQIRMQTSSLTS